MTDRTDDAVPSVPPPTRTLVREAVERAWHRAIGSGALPVVAAGSDVPEVDVERPADPAHGDFATSLALKLARPQRRAPMSIATPLADALATDCRGEDALFERVEVAAPGFVNLWLSPDYLRGATDAARAAGAEFGHVGAPRPLHVNVEFVSANPTGPLHIGNARGAFVGDLLCRVLEAAGHRVTREYYFNDFGSQVRQLGESVRRARLGLPIPEDGYRGDYVLALGREIPDDVWARAEAAGASAPPPASDASHGAGSGSSTTEPAADRGEAEAGDLSSIETSTDPAWIVGQWASEQVRAGIEASLARLGVRFDVWKSESSLYRDGWVQQALDRLSKGGHLYDRDGALWFRSTDFGDDKDRVVRRSNGAFTYFGSDIGYLVDKFSRSYDHLVYIWGADHHGTVARVRNAAQAMGYDKAAVEMLLLAWVRFVREGREISMSKRSGEFITLDELLGEIGVDAARWFMGSRGHTSGIDFDIELAKRQSNENPVYYVQYAHARISSILRKARETGLVAAPSVGVAVRDDPIGAGLARLLLRLPEVVEDAAAAHETQGITAFATELATVFHAYYRDRRVVDAADPAMSGERLALVETARQTLANALALLGISAPESM